MLIGERDVMEKLKYRLKAIACGILASALFSGSAMSATDLKFSLYAISILSPILINSKPILVKYEGSYYSPLFTDLFTNDFYEAKFFGQTARCSRVRK